MWMSHHAGADLSGDSGHRAENYLDSSLGEEMYFDKSGAIQRSTD